VNQALQRLLCDRMLKMKNYAIPDKENGIVIHDENLQQKDVKLHCNIKTNINLFMIAERNDE
jgi:hypothetical protein